MIRLVVLLLTCLDPAPLLAVPETVYLDQLDVQYARQDWGQPHARQSVMGNPLSIGGRRYERGLGTHAQSSLIVDLQGQALRFRASVGVDDEMQGHPGSVEFQVVGDGLQLWRSGTMRVGDPAKPLDVDLQGLHLLSLIVTDAGDGIDSDHADWADAQFTAAGPVAVVPCTYLSALQPVVVRPGWADLWLDRSAGNGPLTIGAQSFAHGLGARAPSDLIYTAPVGRYERLEAWVGVDAAAGRQVGARFRVLVDGEPRFTSPRMKADTPAVFVSVPVSGARELRLVADAAGDAGGRAPADWGEAVLIGRAREAAPPAPRAAAFRVRGGGLTIGLAADGEVVGAALAGRRPLWQAVPGGTRLAGCSVSRRVHARGLPGGGLEFAKQIRDDVHGRRAAVVERFRPAADSVRWELEVQGQGLPWSTAIETRLRWPATPQTRYWTAWADSHSQPGANWTDPLVLAPLTERQLSYGATPYRENYPLIGYCPFVYDVFCLPIVTLAEPGRDAGLSLVQSPQDTLLDMLLATESTGAVVLSRLNHRLTPEAPVRFTMDLVAHEADWRPGLGWMVRRYVEYFEPPNPRAHEIAGCGAYSIHEGDLDVEHLRRMAFRVNWKASYDFPYMGLFLPPVAPEEVWTNFRGTPTSQQSLEAYCRRMRAMDFHVLSYFNVTEFGAGIQWPPPPRRAPVEADLWRDPNDFLYGRLAGAVLLGPDGRPFWTWGNAVAMDPGEPAYEEFLLEQAQRHLDRLPDSSGICIDRTDWLRIYNARRDDGVSWFSGAPARFGVLSWGDLLSRLGPLMRGADKAIFCNLHLKRLEMLREVDGVFDEFTYHGASINPCAFLGLRKPVIGWTAHEDNLKPDPDAFFQRYLHLGIFPMAPFPGNDHSILPSAWAEQQYVDYGPLLDAMRGKRWVLEPHAVEVEGGVAKTNLFAVPDGFVVPVTFGGKAERAAVLVRGTWSPTGGGRWRAEVIRPGEERWAPLPVSGEEPALRLEVPLARGCAVVRLRAEGH